MRKPLGIQKCDGPTDLPTDRHGKVQSRVSVTKKETGQKRVKKKTTLVAFFFNRYIILLDHLLREPYCQKQKVCRDLYRNLECLMHRFVGRLRKGFLNALLCGRGQKNEKFLLILEQDRTEKLLRSIISKPKTVFQLINPSVLSFDPPLDEIAK